MQRVLGDASPPAPVPSNLRPSLASARDRALPYTQGCVNIGVNANLQPCMFGVPGVASTIVLYGDSHAVQWFEPLNQIAIRRGHRLVLLAKGGCPVTDVVVPTPVLRHTCPPYRDAAIKWIETNQPAVVVVSNSYTQYADDAETWAAGAQATMARLAAVPPTSWSSGTTRRVPPTRRPACRVTSTTRQPVRRRGRTPCAPNGSVARSPPPAPTAPRSSTRPTGSARRDLPGVIGDLLVLRDETHLTPPMAEFLTPLLAAALDPVFGAAG